MKLVHWMKKENSGLAHQTLEIVKYEERMKHGVQVRQPESGMPLYGHMNGTGPDLHLIHSQLHPTGYFDQKPKIMWMHGEPLSSVANGVSMKAITDLAPKVDAFICMRREEQAIWQAIKRTYCVQKGVDLEVYKPLNGEMVEKLPGEPAILYLENWRGQRNPLYLCVAMEQVIKKFPKAKLHLYNCNDKRMFEIFKGLIHTCKWWSFISSLKGAVKPSEVNKLYNQVDMVVSCLYPLYARGIESFGAGKPYIGPGYKEPDWPYQCELDPGSMADAITRCWEDYDKMNYRKWAKDRHDVKETVKQAVEVYERYI